MKLYHSTNKDFEHFISAAIGERFWFDNSLDKAGYWFSPSKKWVEEFGKNSGRNKFIKTIQFNKNELKLFKMDSAKIGIMSKPKCWILNLRNNFNRNNIFDLIIALKDNGYQGIHFIKPMVDNYTKWKSDYAEDQYCIFDIKFINKHLIN